MTRPLEGRRVVDMDGHAGTIEGQHAQGQHEKQHPDQVLVRFDYQGPSSAPKRLSLAELRFLPA